MRSVRNMPIATPRTNAGTPPQRMPQNSRCIEAQTCFSRSPFWIIVPITLKILDGGGKNRTSMTPVCAQISHSAISASGETMFMSRSTVWRLIEKPMRVGARATRITLG